MAVSTRALFRRMVPVAACVMLGACETSPAGPGRTIDASASSIAFTHPLYQGVEGEYTHRTGGYNSQSETASYLGPAGMVYIVYHHTAGDTYVSAPDVTDVANSIGKDVEITGEGDVPGTFPVVHWASTSAKGDGDVPMSCVTIVRDGDSASRASGFTSASIMATECRAPIKNLTEEDAAMLSASIRTK